MINIKKSFRNYITMDAFAEVVNVMNHTGLWDAYRFLYVDTPILADQQKIYIHQLCTDTKCCLYD